MKINFNKWLESLLENVGRNSGLSKMNPLVNADSDLKIDRFGDFRILSALPLPTGSNWLVCNLLFNELEDATFHIIKPGDSIMYVNFLRARSGVTLIIGQEFFRPNDCPLIDCALLHLQSQICYPLTALQKYDLLLITEKIEDVSRGRYIFKNEYLQQLLLQVMHFALKNFSACKPIDVSKLPVKNSLSPVIFNDPFFLAN